MKITSKTQLVVGTEIIIDEVGSFYIGIELESNISNPFKFSSIKTEPTVQDKVKFSGILQQITSMNVEDQEFYKLDGFDIHDGILKLGAPSTYGIVTSGDSNCD